MLSEFRRAFTDSAHTLDFISLLLTRYGARGAESSISPSLRNALPTECLGTELMSEPTFSETRKANDELTATGWKLQHLNTAADALLKSATRLEDEIKNEAKYWDQVLSISNSGWHVSRLPRERHALGIQFGFLESPADFRNKGFVPLRRGEDGSVDVDLTVDNRRPRILRSRILRGGQIIACSTDRSSLLDNDSVETAILRARNSVFNSELFAELYREGRSLANRGVRCYENSVSFPLDSDKTMLVEIVDQDSNPPPITAGQAGRNDKALPDLTLIALQLLLTHSHRLNHRRRTQIPPPISNHQVQRIPPAFLRPIISHLQHKAAIEKLTSDLERIQRIFTNAGLELSVSSPTDELDLGKVVQQRSQTDAGDFVHALMETVCGTLNASFQIQSTFQETYLTLQVQTHIQATQYRLFRSGGPAIDMSPDLVISKDIWFYNQLALLSLVVNALRFDLVKAIRLQSQGKWQARKWEVGSGTSGVLESEAQNGHSFQMNICLNLRQLELLWTVAQFSTEMSSHSIKVWDPSSTPEKLGLLRVIELMSDAPVDVDLGDYARQALTAEEKVASQTETAS